MPTEVWILLFVIAIPATWWAANALNRANGETSEQRVYANIAEPIFIEQQFFGYRWQQRAVEDYDYIIERLKECGNKHIKKENVHLFIHNFDVNNPIFDFADWRAKVLTDKQKILENFFIPLAERAAKNGDKAAAARYFAKAGIMDFAKEKSTT